MYVVRAIPRIMTSPRFRLLQGNRDCILASIRIAKSRGAKLRVGPELEIS